MDYEFSAELLRAIKEDDVRAFRSLVEQRPGAWRLGRFPLLSVFYLYRAKKLIALYENDYIGQTSWEELPELPELSTAFSKVASKALRLYHTAVVTPLATLLLMGKTKKVRRLYPSVRLGQEERARLTSLYSVRYGQELSFEENRIVMKDPPLTYAEKKRILLSALSTFLVVAVLVSTPFVINVFSPFIGVSENEAKPEPTPDLPDGTAIGVSDFSEINFTSSREYKLLADVTLPDGFYAPTVTCTIDGDGKRVTTTGTSPVFGTVAGTVKNITFVAEGNWMKTGDFAFVAETNNGTMTEVGLELSGELNVSGTTTSETRLAGIALVNAATNGATGVMESCSVDLDLTIKGKREANASFAGVCSQNNRRIADAVVTGRLTSENCDLAGVCEGNAFRVDNATNRADITQTTAEKEWSPLCAGICLRNEAGYFNTSVLYGCRNEGTVTCESSFDREEEFAENQNFFILYAGGICALNVGGGIGACVNEGEVKGRSVECIAYVGGICAVSQSATNAFYNPGIADSQNTARVEAVSVEINAVAGGIAALAASTSFTSDTNAGAVSVTVENCTYGDSYCAVGGVVGNGNNSSFSSCANGGAVSASGVVPYAYVGGVAAISSAGSDLSNEGNVTLSTESGGCYVGGVVGRANGNVSRAQQKGRIEVLSENAVVYAGGLVGHLIFDLSSSLSEGTMEVRGKELYVGGAIGLSDLYEVKNDREQIVGVYCGTVHEVVSAEEITAEYGEKGYIGGGVGYVKDGLYNVGTENETYIGGTVKTCFFTGSLPTAKTVGGIIGGCEKEYATGDENGNFSDNGYLKNGDYSAFGVYVGETDTSGDDHGATAYYAKEAIESLDAYLQIVAQFSSEE